MYILSKVNKETIWGSRDLIDYGADPGLDKVGSLYTLAANRDLSCTVLNGEKAGMSLYEAYSEDPAAFGLKAGESFPLIASFISAGDDLSIQIHPDDGYAARVEHKPFGKCESWVFLRRPLDGQIVLGCRCADRAELEDKVQKGLWDEIVGRAQVNVDDYVYVTPGTLHALTRGCIVYELQQATDITYRFYDYDRVDAQGKKRDLQLDKAMDVVRLNRQGEVGRFGNTPHAEKEYCMQRLPLRGAFTNALPKFVALTLLEGEIELDGLRVQKGTTIVVLPDETIAFAGEASAICAFSRL